MKQRIFIALPLTSGLKNKIFFLEKETEKILGRQLNWIPLSNLHLTILFLGYLREDDILSIYDIFNNFPKNYLPLSLKIKKIDYGPPGKKKMIWLYFEKNEKIENVKKFFEAEIEKRNINYQQENRDFLPHINLIRLKNYFQEDIKKNLNWQVFFNEIVLFKSHLKKEGAEYEELYGIC